MGDDQFSQLWGGKSDLDGSRLGPLDVSLDFRRRATGVPPQSGKRKQYRPPVSTDRGGIDQTAFRREKRDDMSQCFRREPVDGCEVVLDALRLSQYLRDPQNCIVDLY